MSWRMAPLRALSTTTIPSGAEVRVSDPELPSVYTGEFPSLFVHRTGQDVPDVAVVPDSASSSEDLEYLAEQAQEWVEKLKAAARARRDQEDSEPYQDAG